MGILKPSYLKVTPDDKNTEKDKATKAVWALKNPKKLCRTAREAKFGVVRVAAVQRLVDLDDEEALAKVLFECKDDERRKIEVAVDGIKSQAVLERVAVSAPSGNARGDAAKRVKSQAVLQRIARSDKAAGVRAIATRRLTDSDVLAQIALEDTDDYVRSEAVSNKKLNDPAALAKVALETNHWRTRQYAIQNPHFTDSDALAKIALEYPDSREEAIRNPHLTDPAVLAKAALGDKYASVRRAAVEKKQLVDAQLLAKIALEDPDTGVRLAVISKEAFDNPDLLSRIALEDADRRVRIAAVNSRRITDQALFARIALEDTDVDVRANAVFRLENIDALEQVAARGEETGDKARWLAALKLSRRAPFKAVDPLVKLMRLDRQTSFSGKVAEGMKMTMMDVRKEAIAFLENQYRNTILPEMKNTIASLSDGRYGFLEYDHCSHDDQLIHFDLGR